MRRAGLPDLTVLLDVADGWRRTSLSTSVNFSRSPN
jgi:hypothetical protein